MKKSLALVCAILCIAGMAILAGCPQSDTTDPNNYTISGTVTAADTGIDVTAADIELWQNEQKVVDAIHPNDNGEFSFSDLQTGDAYVVKVSIANYDSWASGSISVPNASALQAELSKKKLSVTGAVSSDFAGTDISKVKLALVRAGEIVAETSPAAGSGEYAFSNLAAGTYYIRASLFLHDSIFSKDFTITTTDVNGKDFALHRGLPELQEVIYKGSNLYLMWDQSVTMTNTDGFSITGADITFTGTAVVPDTDNKEWTLALSRAPLDSETITLDYDNATGTVAHPIDGAKPGPFSKAIQFTLEIVSARILMDGGRRTLSLKFSAVLDFSLIPQVPQTINGGLLKGFELYSGTPPEKYILTSYQMSVTSNSDTVNISLAATPNGGATSSNVFTLSYTDGDIKTVGGVPLSNFSNLPVTNEF